MSKTYTGNVHFAGGLSVGNWAWGYVRVVPEKNTRVTVDVTGLNLSGEGQLIPQVQVHTSHPWSACGYASVFTATDGVDLWNTESNAFRIVFVRNNKAETWISWMVWREVT